MSEHSNGENGSWRRQSRRTVLRKAATAAVAGVGVLAAGSQPANAHLCPRMPEYWRENPDEWPTFPEDTRLVILDDWGNEQWLHPNDSQTRFLAEMSMSDEEDRYPRIVEQFVAARLNRRIVRHHPEIYDDFWDRMAEYIYWIYGADRPQHDWVVNGVDGRALYNYLLRWNYGAGTPCQQEAHTGEHFRARPF